MVARIYTKSGDDGTTGLTTGRCMKDDPRIEAVGTLNELNAILGIILSMPTGGSKISFNLLERIQHDLFELGTEISSQKKPRDWYEGRLLTMEDEIDQLQSEMPPLMNFILPGGTMLAAYYHLACTVCRRAERVCVKLKRDKLLSADAIKYLNRLSDLLFVWARWANQKGQMDVKWKREVAPVA